MIHVYDKNSRTICQITGNGDDVAFEYALITKQLLDDKNGQIILARATNILEKIMKENNDEEERKC